MKCKYKVIKRVSSWGKKVSHEINFCFSRLVLLNMKMSGR